METVAALWCVVTRTLGGGHTSGPCPGESSATSTGLDFLNTPLSLSLLSRYTPGVYANTINMRNWLINTLEENY